MRIRGFSLVAAVAAVLAAIVGTTTAGTASATPMPVTFNFFSGIPGELAHHGGSLPGSNDFSCRPTPKHPYPVVLAHGTGGSQQTNWGAYVPLLKNEGYCVFALTYGALDDLPWPGPAVGGMGLIEDSAAQFGRFVDKVLAATGASKVDVVGHSQGTVVPAYYAKVLGGRGKIDKQVSIAPAWRGSKAAGADQLLPAARRLGISAAQTPIARDVPNWTPHPRSCAPSRRAGTTTPRSPTPTSRPATTKPSSRTHSACRRAGTTCTTSSFRTDVRQISPSMRASRARGARRSSCSTRSIPRIHGRCRATARRRSAGARTEAPLEASPYSTRSKIAVKPCPPPMHMVSSP